MQTLIIIAILAVLGAGAYVAVEKPFQKREGEFTLNDLLEQSKARARGENPRPLNEVSQAAYEGSLLVQVSEDDQKKFRETARKSAIAAYIPTKIPPGGLAPLSPGSSGKEFGINKYQIYFRSKKGDSLLVTEYNLQEFLASSKKTEKQMVGNAKETLRNEKKIYVSYTGVITDPKYLYTQALTIITESVLIRAEYTGETKLSENDMIDLGASFTK